MTPIWVNLTNVNNFFQQPETLLLSCGPLCTSVKGHAHTHRCPWVIKTVHKYDKGVIGWTGATKLTEESDTVWEKA